MSLRPPTPTPVSPSTDLLRNRPGASSIPNPISLADPVLPSVPNALAGFTPADIPLALPVDLEAYRLKVQTASELGLVQEVNNSSNKGLYFRSSANRSAAAKSATTYLSGMAKVVGGVNDVIRQSELVGAKYATADYEVAVKRYTAQVTGVVDRYEANADAYVQAQNIIYQADVTAIKLQDLGVEKAIGLESGFITDVRKTESQAFLGEVTKLEGIASREVGARSQIRIAEMRQLGTQGYTLYEHTRNNDARSYESGVISRAEYQNASDLYGVRTEAARTASEQRRLGAIKVAEARLGGIQDTTAEKGIQQNNKYAIDLITTTNESNASGEAMTHKFAALLSASETVSAGEISKIQRVTANATVNKGLEYAATNTQLGLKTAARIAATIESVAKRTSINPERIAAAVDGYKLNVQARIDAAKIEAKAQRDAIPIITKAVVDVAVENAKWATQVFDLSLTQVKENNSAMLEVEKENAGKESAANVASIQTIGEAETKAAADRAGASTRAATTRNNASIEATKGVNANSLAMIKSKLELLNSLEKLEFGGTEQVASDLNEVKLAVEAAGAQATLDNQAIKDSLDLETLKGLNIARLAGEAGKIKARLDHADKETTAKIKAAGVLAGASVYAAGMASDAALYGTIRSNEATRIIQTNSAIVNAHHAAANMRATIRSRQSAVATQYWITSATQDQRQDIFTAKKGK